jgi:glucosamine-6-phosphate deaminase
LTLTIPALISGQHLFCCVPGATKRAAVEQAVYGPIDPACPASVLRMHADCTLYVDADSWPG